jgi:hypothetical protein
MSKKTLSQVWPFGVLLLLGAFLVFTGVRQRTQAQASSGWPSVQGKALSAEVKTESHTDTRTHQRRTSFRPAVAYEYQVNGVSYRGSRVAFADFSNLGSSDAQRILSQVVQGDSVQVFYNPQDPTETVLLNANVPGTDWKIIGGVALILLVIAYLVWAFVLHKRAT